MATPANGHSLTIGALTLDLPKERFNASGEQGQRGYRRDIQQEQFASLEYNLRVSSLVSGFSIDAMRMEFKWDLLMPPDEADLLEAIIKFQRREVADKVAGIAIRLNDCRILLSEPVPRTHAAIGTVDTITNPGTVRYFPRFDILFTEYTRDVYLENCLDAIQMTALELDLVPTSEDIP